MPIDLHDSVDDVMRCHPAAIRIFIDHQMECVGCPVAAFHSVEDACIKHGVDCGDFLRALNRAVIDRSAHSQPA